MLTQHDLDELGKILGGEGTHFSAHLVRLIKKADHENRMLLASIYPKHVLAVERWELHPDQRQTLAKTGRF